MRLVYKYNWVCDHVASGTVTIPFEYLSILEFQYMVLEKLKVHKDEYMHTYGMKYGKKEALAHYSNSTILLFGYNIKVEDLENIEHDVYTLEDWFDKNKETCLE